MSSDEDALLAAIAADPDDDIVRLAFADYLQERGDAVSVAWATFVRAHIRLNADAAAPGDVPDVMRFGAKDWLRQFARRLGVPALGGVRLEAWERGLPDAVTADFDAARWRWDELVARVPFRRLRLRGANDDAVEDFVNWPRLERLTALDLTDENPSDRWRARVLGERGVAALTTCPALVGLERLSFGARESADRVAELVLNSRHLAGLRHLHLDGYPRLSAEWRERLRERFGASAV